MFLFSCPSPLYASLLLTESKRITPTHLWSFFLTNISDHWWAGFTNLQLLKISWRCTVRLSSGCYLLSLSSISQDHLPPPTTTSTSLVVPTMGVSVSYVVKFETRASQVPLACLHVTRSSVIETLIMHRSFKMDKC